MLDDTPHAQFFLFAGRKMRKDALIEAAEAISGPKVAPPQRGSVPPTPPKDNRTLFIEAMADPTKRQIAFNVVERNCRARFAEGEEGINLYFQLLTDVRHARLDEAADEFERRFLPMLDRDLLLKRIEQARKAA